jgi:hypothetical protein
VFSRVLQQQTTLGQQQQRLNQPGRRQGGCPRNPAHPEHSQTAQQPRRKKFKIKSTAGHTTAGQGG